MTVTAFILQLELLYAKKTSIRELKACRGRRPTLEATPPISSESAPFGSGVKDACEAGPRAANGFPSPSSIRAP